MAESATVGEDTTGANLTSKTIGEGRLARTGTAERFSRAQRCAGGKGETAPANGRDCGTAGLRDCGTAGLCCARVSFYGLRGQWLAVEKRTANNFVKYFESAAPAVGARASSPAHDVSIFAKVRAVRTGAAGSLSSVWNEGEGWGEEALRTVGPLAMVKHPSPRSCLTGRGRRTRFLLQRFRHELSQQLIATKNARGRKGRIHAPPPAWRGPVGARASRPLTASP